MQLVEKNGIRISQLTLGTVQLGMPYGIANRNGMPDEQASFQLLDLAISEGIVSFDTAQSYGQSEAVLGRYFKGVGDYTLITKCVLDLDKSAGINEIERYLTERVEASLARLNISKIPILMLHHASDLLKFGPSLLHSCRQLVKHGYVQSMGLSFGADPVQLTQEIWTYARDPVFEAIQVPMNVLDQRLIHSGLLQQIGNAGKTVFARSLFLQGLLFLEPLHMPDKLKASTRYIDRLRRLAEHEGMSLAEMAISFVRDLPQVHSLVIGAETMDQVASNVKLLQASVLSENTRHELEQLMTDVPDIVISPHLWHV